MFGSKIIPPKQANQVMPGPMAPGGGGGMMKQMAGMGMKAALSGSPLAPLSGMLGGLFNEGGKVPSLAEQINWGGKYSKPKPKPERAWYDPRGWVGLNMGGPLSAHPNPHGYNEGGAVAETPIKKVMDEQKLEQQALAFERGEDRKDQMHELDMKIKQQQFEQAQKMKREASTTSMSPAKPKPRGPLSGGKK